MAESALTVEIVPIRPEDKFLLLPLERLLLEILLEVQGYSKGEIDERMGNIWIDFDRAGNRIAGDLAGVEFWEALGEQA